MRLSDLLGRPVVDAAGTTIGGIADVRLVQDGRLLPSMSSALRIDGLIVVEHRSTHLFGYERHVGPALLRRLVHSRLGEVWYVPWRDVATVEDAVAITVRRADLKPLQEMARH